MKKKVVIAVVVIAVLVVAAFVVHFNNSQTEIPNKELVYLQLDTKGEDFVLSQIEGLEREKLIAKWGDPDGTPSGFYGDIWAMTENEKIVVYYSADSVVEHIKLEQNGQNK